MNYKLLRPFPPPTRHYLDHFGLLVFDHKRYQKDLLNTKLINKLIWLINQDRGSDD